MAHRLIGCALGLMLVGPGTLLPQSSTMGVASLAATVIDSTSSKPVLRVMLSRSSTTGPGARMVYHSRADTTGELRLDSVPAGEPQRFEISCDQGRLFQVKRLDTLIVTLAPGKVRHWEAVPWPRVATSVRLSRVEGSSRVDGVRVLRRAASNLVIRRCLRLGSNSRPLPPSRLECVGRTALICIIPRCLSGSRGCSLDPGTTAISEFPIIS
jgi:hypothetical protein